MLQTIIFYYVKKINKITINIDVKCFFCNNILENQLNYCELSRFLNINRLKK